MWWLWFCVCTSDLKFLFLYVYKWGSMCTSDPCVQVILFCVYKWSPCHPWATPRWMHFVAAVCPGSPQGEKCWDKGGRHRWRRGSLVDVLIRVSDTVSTIKLMNDDWVELNYRNLNLLVWWSVLQCQMSSQQYPTVILQLTVGTTMTTTPW